MPELPDVERFRRILEAHGVGEKVAAVDVADAGVIRGRSAADFVVSLAGRRFGATDRRGKWLTVGTDGPTLLFHFGMTGSLVWDDVESQHRRFDRVAISLSRGKLIFRDQRKLGGLWLADGEDGIRAVIGEQGPDALGLTGQRLDARLAGHRRGLKSVLMDQSVLGGVGNMLSDEVLWRAKIHPARRFDDLDASERQQLRRCLQRVLRASVQAGEIPRQQRWLSSQRAQPNPRCPRCGASLLTTPIGGRTSYWCPVCQEPEQ